MEKSCSKLGHKTNSDLTESLSVKTVRPLLLPRAATAVFRPIVVQRARRRVSTKYATTPGPANASNQPTLGLNCLGESATADRLLTRAAR